MQVPVEIPTRRPELDEHTLRLAQRGDHAAFRRLVERYHAPVYQMIWRMVAWRSGQARVEELTQETFLRIFRALGSFRPGGEARLSTWILTIATRLALNELRRPSDREHGASDPLEGASEGSPELELERRELARAVGLALERLSPEQRAVLVLREYHGLEYSEISLALEVELNTVRSRLSRARVALRQALEEVLR